MGESRRMGLVSWDKGGGIPWDIWNCVGCAESQAIVAVRFDSRSLVG